MEGMLMSKTSEVGAFHKAFNKDGMLITESSGIYYGIGDLIKSWLRLLPEPVFPSPAYFTVIEVISTSVFLARVPD